MKSHFLVGASLLLILTFPVLSQEGESSSDSPQLPDLPEVNPAAEVPAPEMGRDQSTPATPELPETRRPNRPTQEQIEKAQKEKNWLLEGLKENEAKAEAARQEQESQQTSIIDQILNKNRDQMGAEEVSAPMPQAESAEARDTFQPALSTSAFEPLPEIEGSDSLAEAQSKIENAQNRQQQTWKAVDEKTGVANVFFNTRTGMFESQPVEYNRNSNAMEVEWQRQQRLQNQVAPNRGTEAVEEEVLAFESQLVEQAKAQNKLPEEFAQTNSREAMTFNPGRLESENSPYLFANQNNRSPGSGAGAAENAFQRNQPSFTAQQGNDAALAKLRMIEEERQKRFENEQKPTILEIHTPRPTRTLEINPRFD